MTEQELKAELKKLVALVKSFGSKSNVVKEFIDNHDDKEFSRLANLALNFWNEDHIRA